MQLRVKKKEGIGDSAIAPSRGDGKYPKGDCASRRERERERERGRGGGKVGIRSLVGNSVTVCKLNLKHVAKIGNFIVARLILYFDELFDCSIK